jgi:hypothetical protein
MAAFLAENGIAWPFALEHRQHRVLRFEVRMRREIARTFLKVLQRRPEIPPYHYRTCLSHRNRQVTVVHAYVSEDVADDKLYRWFYTETAQGSALACR